MLIYNGIILAKMRDSSAEDRYQMLIIRWSGFVLTLISGCALASLHFAVEAGAMPLDAGGILGQISGNYFSHGLGFVGATVLHLALFLSGLTLFTGLSWLALVDNLGKYTLMAIDKLIDRYYLLRDRVEGKRNRSEREQVFQVQKQKQEQRKPVKIEPVVEKIETSPRVEKEKQIPLFKPSRKGGSTIPPLSLLDPPPSKVARFRHRDRGRIGAPRAGHNAFRNTARSGRQGQPDFQLIQGPGALVIGHWRARCRNHPGQVGDGAGNPE